MNKKIGKSIMAGLACCLTVLLGGCDNSIPSDEDTDKFIIQLKMPPVLEVVTKANNKLDGITIADVWVVQFNKKNGTLLSKSNYTNIGDAQTNQTIEVATSGFSNIESYFYVIANAGIDKLNDFDGTAADLKKITMQITVGTSDEPNFLSAGPILYTPKTDEGSGSGESTSEETTVETQAETTEPALDADQSISAVIVAPLQRTFAKISVQWKQLNTDKGTVAITKVEAANLPNTPAFFSRGGSEDLSATYPSDVPTEVKKIGDGNLAANTPRTFHMAENLRGMGTGTTFAEKNQKSKAPNGTLENCTYVLLSGTYTYAGATSPIGVQYKIYLGGNLKNDYNIQRGNLYTLTVSISGANSADLRVSITDGNVAIFDDVDTITNEITFGDE